MVNLLIPLLTIALVSCVMWVGVNEINYKNHDEMITAAKLRTDLGIYEAALNTYKKATNVFPSEENWEKELNSLRLLIPENDGNYVYKKVYKKIGNKTELWVGVCYAEKYGEKELKVMQTVNEKSATVLSDTCFDTNNKDVSQSAMKSSINLTKWVKTDWKYINTGLDPSIPDITESTKPTVPDVTESTKPTVPDVTESTEPTVPDITESTEPTVPDITESTEPTDPDVTEPTEPTDPDVTEPTEPTDPDVTEPTSNWDKDKVYVSGDVVIHNGIEWEAQWWTRGEEPGTTGEWGVWRTEPTEPTNAWNKDKAYIAGDIVTHNGVEWEAQWWTRGEEPSTTGKWGVWQLVDTNQGNGNGNGNNCNNNGNGNNCNNNGNGNNGNNNSGNNGNGKGNNGKGKAKGKYK